VPGKKVRGRAREHNKPGKSAEGNRVLTPQKKEGERGKREGLKMEPIVLGGNLVGKSFLAFGEEKSRPGKEECADRKN